MTRWQNMFLVATLLFTIANSIAIGGLGVKVNAILSDLHAERTKP